MSHFVEAGWRTRLPAGPDALAPTRPSLALGLPNSATADALTVGEPVQRSAKFGERNAVKRAVHYPSSADSVAASQYSVYQDGRVPRPARRTSTPWS
jgi:hypothetical protein